MGTMCAICFEIVKKKIRMKERKQWEREKGRKEDNGERQEREERIEWFWVKSIRGFLCYSCNFYVSSK